MPYYGRHRADYAASSRARSLAKKALKEGQMSSLRWICTVWKFGCLNLREELIMLLP